MRWVLALLAALPLGAVAAGVAPDKSGDSDISLKVGHDRTDGNYDQKRNTSTITESIDVSYDTDDWSVDVMASYLRETGPGRVIFLPGRRPFIIIGPERSASGIGDVTAGVTRYVLDEETSGIDLDLGAIVKFGTASADKGLGTGKDDVSVQVALGRSLGALSSTLTAGYTYVGKVPGLGLKNSAYGSLDANYKLPESTHVGFTYSVGQTSASGVMGTRDAQLYGDFRPYKRVKFEVYVMKGWGNQSPDRGGGVTLAFDL